MNTVTVRDAARRLGMSTQGITKYCSIGKLKAAQKRPGSPYAIDVESLEALIEKRGIEDKDAAMVNISNALDVLTFRVNSIEEYLATPREVETLQPPLPPQEDVRTPPATQDTDASHLIDEITRFFLEPDHWAQHAEAIEIRPDGQRLAVPWNHPGAIAFSLVGILRFLGAQVAPAVAQEAERRIQAAATDWYSVQYPQRPTPGLQEINDQVSKSALLAALQQAVIEEEVHSNG